MVVVMVAEAVAEAVAEVQVAQVGRLLRSLCTCRGSKSKKGNAVADAESDGITDKQTEDN